MQVPLLRFLGGSRDLPLTSLQIQEVVGCQLYGGTIPPHVGEGFAAGLDHLSGCLDDGLHELQVAAAKLHLGYYQPVQLFAVLRLVQC